VADILISYTSSDRDWAFWIGKELEKLGHVPHIHEWEISGGGDIAAWMEERADKADHILCVISEIYLTKPYSSWERRAAQWAAATERPNFALPVFIEDCKAPTLLGQFKRCDLTGVSEDDARARLAAFLAPAKRPRGVVPFPGGAPAKMEIAAGDVQTAAPAIGVYGDKIVQGITEAEISKLLEVAREGGVFQRAEQEGISEFAVRKVVARLGGEGIARTDLLPWLDNWVEAAQRELSRLPNEDEAFEAARQEAESRIKAGRLEDASAALMEEFARGEQAKLEQQEERKRRRLRLLKEAIGIDELALRADAATQKLRRVAEIEGQSGWQDIGAYLFAQAGEYYDRGDQKGENSALLISIAAYRAVLEEWTPARAPRDWARTQMNLGNALARLGERESGTARLEEAVAAFRAGLQELTRERAPLDWARTQMNLGNALGALGERESGTARLEEAVAACHEALQELTRERAPLD